jgi:hypothetical protein
MTAALAGKYLVCKNEQVSGNGNTLLLVEDLTVNLGGGVPYNPKTFRITDIDTKALVYPLRASFKGYQCDTGNIGYNCNIYYVEKAPGTCYKTTFGDWSCSIDYSFTSSFLKNEKNMPPPKSGIKTDAAPAKDKPAAKNDKQAAETKTEGNAVEPETGLPKPDFSEMEKYFDISKLEYNASFNRWYFIGKLTKKHNADTWHIYFYDKDGIKVSDTGIVMESGDYENIGGVAKYYAGLPRESQWKFVKKVVITREIY